MMLFRDTTKITGVVKNEDRSIIQNNLSGMVKRTQAEDTIKHKVTDLGRKHADHIQTTGESWKIFPVKT